jgi:hypothetical protein
MGSGHGNMDGVRNAARGGFNSLFGVFADDSTASLEQVDERIRIFLRGTGRFSAKACGWRPFTVAGRDCDEFHQFKRYFIGIPSGVLFFCSICGHSFR